LKKANAGGKSKDNGKWHDQHGKWKLSDSSSGSGGSEEEEDEAGEEEVEEGEEEAPVTQGNLGNGKSVVVNRAGLRPVIYTQTNKRVTVEVTEEDIADYGSVESAVHAIRVENEEVLL
jgi:hypothetical protein